MATRRVINGELPLDFGENRILFFLYSSLLPVPHPSGALRVSNSDSIGIVWMTKSKVLGWYRRPIFFLQDEYECINHRQYYQTQYCYTDHTAHHGRSDALHDF